MALIKCPECGKNVSDTCSHCIHCGYKLNYQDSSDKFNNQNEISDSAECKTNEEHLEVISYRGGAGGMVAVGVIDIVLGAVAIIFSTVWIFINPSNILCLLFLALGVLCLVCGIVGVTRIAKNNSAASECIVYDKQSNILILKTYGGRVIKIHPEQYVKLSCNIFTTDNMIVVCYKNASGKIMKAKLGYARDVYKTRELLKQITQKASN